MGVSGYGQTPTGKIVVLSQVKNNTVQFRFFQSTPDTWQKANQYGYQIVRKTMQGTQVIATKTINIDGIKASDSTSTKWVPYFKKDSAAYYSLFRLTAGVYDATRTQAQRIAENSRDSVNIQAMPQHTALTELFAYSFMAAGEKYNAAKLAGLGYDDTDIQTQYQYEYKISTRIPTNVMVVNDTTIKINTPGVNTPKVLPPKPKVVIDKRLVYLSWNGDSLRNNFYFYHVLRRSSAQSKFEQINDVGLINGSEETNQIVYRDSIPNKTLKYTYRIAGKTYFDDLNTSDSIVIDIKQYIDVDINIQSVNRVGSNLNINWVTQTPLSTPIASNIKYYTLSVSNNDSTQYKVLQNNISLNLTSLSIPFSSVKAVVDTTKGMYFKILAVGLENDITESSAFYLFANQDKRPPNKPQNLSVQGSNQASGNHHVTLSWTANTESNLLGYKVFRKIGNDTTLVEISGGVKNKISIIDTLHSKMEYPILTYYVAAFNQDNRRSDFSIITYLKKDTRGPISPIITDYSIINTSVILNWKNSPDIDVAQTVILRKELNSTAPWVTVKIIGKTETLTQFEDKNLVEGKTYVYTMYAIDDSNNQSCYDVPSYNSSLKAEDCYQLMPVKVVSNSPKPEFTNFTGLVAIESPKIDLTWSYDGTKVKNYEVYRSVKTLTDQASPSLLSWKSFTSLYTNFTDLDVSYNKLYTYAIRANFEDGTTSNLKKIEVNVPNFSACTYEKQIIRSSKLLQAVDDMACYEIILQTGFDSSKLNYKAEIKK